MELFNINLTIEGVVLIKFVFQKKPVTFPEQVRSTSWNSII